MPPTATVASNAISLPLESSDFRVIRPSTFVFVRSVLSMLRTNSLKVIVTLLPTGTSVEPSTGDQIIAGAIVSAGAITFEFSYQAIVSSSREADSTSISPSPSKSKAKTERAP